MKLGFIGQGWIGKNYADHYEDRGFEVVRYSKEEPHSNNKDTLLTCDIVYVAVPAPTTPQGFDDSIIREVLSLVSPKSIVVVKSTLALGTTERLAKLYPTLTIMYSPEFLSERTAREDVDYPAVHVLGLPEHSDEYQKKAKELISILPQAPHTIVCKAEEAELMKYAHNIHGFIQIVFANVLYDIAEKRGLDWGVVKDFISHDPYMIDRYATPVHASGHTEKKGRGAGGHCFIKDFATFKSFYEKINSEDTCGILLLTALEKKNNELLTHSGKDLDILKEVYGN